MRAVPRLAVLLHEAVVGSNTSVVATGELEKSDGRIAKPPETRTPPLGRSVDVCDQRATDRLPTLVQVEATGSKISDNPVAETLPVGSSTAKPPATRSFPFGRSVAEPLTAALGG